MLCGCHLCIISVSLCGAVLDYNGGQAFKHTGHHVLSYTNPVGAGQKRVDHCEHDSRAGRALFAYKERLSGCVEVYPGVALTFEKLRIANAQRGKNCVSSPAAKATISTDLAKIDKHENTNV